jgi:hypothetical protein
MSTTRTTSSLSGTIPALADPANIVTAFSDYHDSLANTSTGVAVLARANTFTAPITMSAATQLLFNDATTTEGRFLASSGVMYIQAGSSSGDTSAELRITRNTTTATNISALKLYADNTTLNGTLNLVAGTASISPLTITSGINLTTDVAGAMEYNGQLFFTNNTTTKRGLVSPKHVYSLTSTRSLVTTAGSQSLFGVSLALEANTVYEFDLWFALTSQTSASGSSTTIQASLALPTSSTGSYEATYSSGTSSASPTTTFASVTGTPLTSGNVTYSGTSSTATGQYHVKGIIRTSSSGAFTPNIVIANASNALSSLTLSAGAYVTVNKVGAANANIVTGAWT